MGIMLSVLCSYMGAVELVFIVRDLTHQLAMHQMRLGNEERKQSDISILQDKIKASINALETVDIESTEQMQDGVLYKNGYRIENEQSVNEVAQQWDERRKVMSVSEVSTIESPPKSTVSNGRRENGTHNDRTKNFIEHESTAGYSSSSLNDDEPNEKNNYRPITRDTGTRKTLKKRNSSSSQSSDSIRLSREEELKMFSSLEEEEYKNSSFTPISYSNDSFANSKKNIDSSFHEKQKYDVAAWNNQRPSNYHDSELWKRERATSIEEEKEDNFSNTKNVSSSTRSGVIGTADKPTRKTSCEKDTYASDIDACEPLNKVDNFGLCTLNSNDAKITEESVDVRHFEAIESNRVIKKIDNLPNLNQYFNDALENDVELRETYDADATTEIIIDKPCVETDATKSRDIRSSTVYSRSDSGNSNIIFHQSISSDSSSTCNESNADFDYQRRPIYDRTDSSISFIQGELDSEEYHHNHRFSVTAETLEYIRGRDDWRAHTENKLNNLYRRQSSNIRIREEVDSDEYHHDRKLSDLIEIAYLDSENIRSLPSSFEDNKVFDRYYLELQRINGQLSSDIEQRIAQKQVILLDSNQIEGTEGYLYPLPDIIIDQVSDNGDDSYTIEQCDSDYSNLSDSEDDIQSVIEVTHGSRYDGEIITTLDMDGDIDEMIEVTLWDLNDDRERSSKESSVEIISISNENLIDGQMYADQSDELLLVLDEVSNNEEITNDLSEVIATDDIPNNHKFITTETENAYSGTEDETSTDFVNTSNTTPSDNIPGKIKQLSHNKTTENSDNITIETVQETSEKDGDDLINNLKTASGLPENSAALKETNDIKENIVESTIKTESPLQIETKDNLLHTLDQNRDQRPLSLIEISKSFIEQENLSLAQESGATHSRTVDNTAISTSSDKSKKTKKVESNENMDDLIKEGSMGVWFHK